MASARRIPGPLRGPRINPKPITGRERIADLVDNAFLAYNAGRLREACHLFTNRMLKANVTVGMSLTGARSPASRPHPAKAAPRTNSDHGPGRGSACRKLIFQRHADEYRHTEIVVVEKGAKAGSAIPRAYQPQLIGENCRSRA